MNYMSFVAEIAAIVLSVVTSVVAVFNLYLVPKQERRLRELDSSFKKDEIEYLRFVERRDAYIDEVSRQIAEIDKYVDRYNRASADWQIQKSLPDPEGEYFGTLIAIHNSVANQLPPLIRSLEDYLRLHSFYFQNQLHIHVTELLVEIERARQNHNVVAHSVFGGPDDEHPSPVFGFKVIELDELLRDFYPKLKTQVFTELNKLKVHRDQTNAA